jgi:hypothetical protein
MALSQAAKKHHGGVSVGVDQAGHDQAARHVEGGVSARPVARCNFNDPAIPDDEITWIENLIPMVQGEDERAA